MEYFRQNQRTKSDNVTMSNKYFWKLMIKVLRQFGSILWSRYVFVIRIDTD